MEDMTKVKKRTGKMEVDADVVLKAYELMCTARRMAETYD